jgi:RNA polymerase sigma factor (sigma-70 family)
MNATIPPPTDRELVRAFAATRDEAAFAEIVRRHGPMVLAVCRRVLADAPDADDAFQAVFLVLARRAGSVGQPERLGGWLHGVAVRCARRARSAAARRRAKEHPMLDVAAPAAADPLWADARLVLDEEIGRLPEKLRAALVLCELEGLGRAEAAERLGVPEGTLSSRLARAKEALRSRLVRRGLAPTLVGVGLILSQAKAAAVPPALFDAAVGLAAGVPAAGTGVVSVAAAGLAQKELTAMLVKKLVLSVAVAVGVLGAAGLGWYGWTAARADEKAAKADKDTKADKDKVQGKWKITEAVLHGRSLPPARAAALLGDPVEFKGDKVTLPAEMTFTLDPSKSPKWIDMSSADGKGFVGVYALDGDKLTLHYAAPGSADRPTELEFKQGVNTTRLVLERVK